MSAERNSEVQVSSAPPAGAPRILLICGAILALYTVVVFLFISTQPTWGDEVSFTDPAANLYFHGKFISSAFPYQKLNELSFSGGPPLYALILGGWFHLVGFGLFQARFLCWIFACIGIVVSLAAIHRAKLLPAVRYPWLIALFLAGYGVTFCIWNIRYDTLDFALVATVLYGLAANGKPPAEIFRRAALFLVPAASTHVIFVALFLYSLLVWRDRKTFRLTLIDMGFLAAGAVALVGFYGAQIGVGRYLLLTVLSANTLLGQAARGVVFGVGSFALTKLTMLGRILTQDPSYTLVLVAVLVLGYMSWKKGWRPRPAVIGLAAGAIGLPIFLCIIGKYAVYYSWIGWSCMCVLFLSVLDDAADRNARLKTVIATSVLCVAALTGVFRYVHTNVVDAPEPGQRAELIAAIESLPAGNGIFYANEAAYFEARHKAKYVYTATYAQNHFLPGYPTIAPVTTMIATPEEFAKMRGLLGGTWNCGWKATKRLGLDRPLLQICTRV